MEKWVQRYEIRYAHDITQKADGTFVTYEAYKQLQDRIEQQQTRPSVFRQKVTCALLDSRSTEEQCKVALELLHEGENIIEQQQGCIRELLDACKATKQRIAFIGLPSEPTNKDGPDWSKEIALLEPTIAKTEAMLKPTTEKTKTKERIITKEYEGVRCGHCGGRSKIGEVWLISEKDWIGDNPICYGHKRCVEDAIAKAEEMLK